MPLLLAAVAVTALLITFYSRAEWPWIALGFVALVPWLAALDRVAHLRQALLSGLLMCEAYVLVLFHWLPDALHSLSGLPWTLCLAVIVVAAPFIAPQFIALAGARHLANARNVAAATWLAPLAGVLAYVGIDWAMPKLAGDTLAIPLYGSSYLRQGADMVGVHGLTFMLVLANECVLRVLRVIWRGDMHSGRVFAPATCLLVLVLAPLGYGVLRHSQLSSEQAGGESFSVGLVQAGFSHYDRMAGQVGSYIAVRTILDAHIALSRHALANDDVDLLVWPETVYPLSFGRPANEEGAIFDERIKELVARTGRPLIFGAYDVAEEGSFNAAYFLEPEPDSVRVAGVYHKARLYPLTEWVPALFHNEMVRGVMPWLGTWTRGSGPSAFSLMLSDGRDFRVTPLICFDAISPGPAIAGVREGGDIILTLSNDSWFEYGHMPRLILMISAFRSIETRRPQLRVTNTGISAVILPNGDIIETLGQGEHGVLLANITAGSGSTLLLRLGNWFGPVALAGALLAVAIALGLRRRSWNETGIA